MGNINLTKRFVNYIRSVLLQHLSVSETADAIVDFFQMEKRKVCSDLIKYIEEYDSKHVSELTKREMSYLIHQYMKSIGHE